MFRLLIAFVALVALGVPAHAYTPPTPPDAPPVVTDVLLLGDPMPGELLTYHLTLNSGVVVLDVVPSGITIENIRTIEPCFYADDGTDGWRCFIQPGEIVTVFARVGEPAELCAQSIALRLTANILVATDTLQTRLTQTDPCFVYMPMAVR